MTWAGLGGWVGGGEAGEGAHGEGGGLMVGDVSANGAVAVAGTDATQDDDARTGTPPPSPGAAAAAAAVAVAVAAVAAVVGGVAEAAAAAAAAVAAAATVRSFMAAAQLARTKTWSAVYIAMSVSCFASAQRRYEARGVSNPHLVSSSFVESRRL